MKVVRQNYCGKEVVLTVSEAFADTLESGRDYYGSRADDAMRSSEKAGEKLSLLIELLAEKSLLNVDEVEKLLGPGYAVTK